MSSRNFLGKEKRLCFLGGALGAGGCCPVSLPQIHALPGNALPVLPVQAYCWLKRTRHMEKGEERMGVQKSGVDS